ncbi:hypothetical protein OAS39_00895 [Pirellulales bacterium]|nr:hypothetical protein [Pirellulales bacterium]
MRQQSAASSIAEQGATAIDCAHYYGIVHCDLKPANVLLGPRDQVSVSDFGFAFLVAGVSSANASTIGQECGQLHYWSRT